MTSATPSPPTAILASTRISANPAPDRWLLVLHGIYGRGRNWTTVAKRFTQQRPEWGVILADLRHHGDSPDLPPPHTIEACAEDVRQLVASLALDVSALAGHSFGGKVALRAAELLPVPSVWLMDATPHARPAGGTAWDLLDIAADLPGTFGARHELVQALLERGLAEGLAKWMATNLVVAGPVYRWRLDFTVMRALLVDYFATDLWRVIETAEPPRTVHVVKAAQSSTLDEDSCARVERAGTAHGSVALHRIGGGHWINAENPEAVVELWGAHLP